MHRALLLVVLTGGVFMGSGAVGLEAGVRDHLGSPTLFINGEPVTPFVLYAEPNLSPDMPFVAQAEMARKAGVKILSFSAPMPWPRPGEEPDFSGIDQAMRDALSVHPEALVIIRFGIPAPIWWLDEHPGEEMVFSDSDVNKEHIRWVSVASEAWRNEFPVHLARFVEWAEAHWGEQMLGYHPCNLSTAEWFYKRAWEPVHSGFEEPMRVGFTQWVRTRYGDIETLRTVWNQPEATWDAIRVPTVAEREQADRGMFLDPATEQFVMDFTEYQQIAVVEPMELAARVVKEGTSHKKLVTYFYGYHFELANIPKGPGASGHMALARLLKSPNVDIITSPISYYQRGAGGLNAFMVPVDSVRAAGKLFLSEDDTRTHHTVPGTPFAAITATRDLDETRWEHRRNFGRLYPRRMATWYMDLISEGWLNDPDIWEEIARLRGLYDTAINEPTPFDPQVAVVMDERSAAGLAADRSLSGPLGSLFRADWYRMGTDFRVHLLTDVLEKRIELPEVTLFIGCWNINDSERETIHKALEGKTALWFYGSGFQGERIASAERIAALTGLPVEESTEGTAQIQWQTHAPYGAPDQIIRPRWSVPETEGVVPLATFTDDHSTAVATRDTGRFRSVYIGALGCPAALLRSLLREAGVHLYLDSDDVVCTDGRFLTVSASSAGDKAILLPPGKKLVRIDEDQPVVIKQGRALETFRLGETREYLIVPE